MVLTAWAMTASTFQLFVGVVLATNIIGEFGISRLELGLLGAINTGVGAVTAPRLGRLADRLGVRWSMVALGGLSAAGFLLTALAQSYTFLLVASAVSGLPQGASNPVTNKVISEEVPAAQQASVTGVKQSGVQFAVFLAGATLPTAAITIGWRWALVIMAGLTLVVAAYMSTRFGGHPVSASSPRPGSAAALSDKLDPFVYQVAIYAFLLGMTAGGLSRFYPLFAQEALGYSERTAGLAVSITGLAAIVARVIWARAVDTIIGARPALLVLAIGSAASALALLLAEGVAAWILWPTVVAMAFSVVAWNVVAMLAVIRSVPSRQAGRATGVVLLGFLGGLTISAPLVGLAADATGSYRVSWVVLATLALGGAVAVSRTVGNSGTLAPTGTSRSPKGP